MKRTNDTNFIFISREKNLHIVFLETNYFNILKMYTLTFKCLALKLFLLFSCDATGEETAGLLLKGKLPEHSVSLTMAQKVMRQMMTRR